MIGCRRRRRRRSRRRKEELDWKCEGVERKKKGLGCDTELRCRQEKGQGGLRRRATQFQEQVGLDKEVWIVDKAGEMKK